MERSWRILLFGKSVILGTLAASLRHYPQLDICVLSAPFPVVNELKAMTPDVIIFDVASPRPEAAFTLLETYPGLLLIGVDASQEEMLVLSNHPVQAVAVHDLVRLILDVSQFHRPNTKNNSAASSGKGMEMNDSDEAIANL